MWVPIPWPEWPKEPSELAERAGVGARLRWIRLVVSYSLDSISWLPTQMMTRDEVSCENAHLVDGL